MATQTAHLTYNEVYYELLKQIDKTIGESYHNLSYMEDLLADARIFILEYHCDGTVDINEVALTIVIASCKVMQMMGRTYMAMAETYKLGIQMHAFIYPMTTTLHENIINGYIKVSTECLNIATHLQSVAEELVSVIAIIEEEVNNNRGPYLPHHQFINTNLAMAITHDMIAETYKKLNDARKVLADSIVIFVEEGHMGDSMRAGLMKNVKMEDTYTSIGEEAVMIHAEMAKICRQSIGIYDDVMTVTAPSSSGANYTGY